jgi:hypothetical protein
MKKILIAALVLLILAGCSGNTVENTEKISVSSVNQNTNLVYQVSTEFFYSDDAGKTYGNRTKEFLVGKNVYMQLVIKVTSNSSNPEKIGVDLIIPKITAVDAKYFDGQTITPEVDTINQITTYPFVVEASNDPAIWRFVFNYIPNSSSDVTIKVIYDSKIDSIHDKQNTVSFVAP